MADNGLRLDRFYAGGPVCSPTRASVLTSRTHDRRESSITDMLLENGKGLSRRLSKSGYATGHFGKWHLNGLRGPGVPVLSQYPNGPKDFGFQKWLSVTNFRSESNHEPPGKFEEFQGDSSEIIVKERSASWRNRYARSNPFHGHLVWHAT